MDFSKKKTRGINTKNRPEVVHHDLFFELIPRERTHLGGKYCSRLVISDTEVSQRANVNRRSVRLRPAEVLRLNFSGKRGS